MKVCASSEMSNIDIVFCPAVLETPPVGCDWYDKKSGECFIKRGPQQGTPWSPVTPCEAKLWIDQSDHPEVVKSGRALRSSGTQGSKDLLQDYRTWHSLLNIFKE